MSHLSVDQLTELPEMFSSMSYRKLRFIAAYLRMTQFPEDLAETFNEMSTTGSRSLKIEWMGYDPSIPTRHRYCRITTGKVHDAVIPADQVEALCRLLQERIGELKYQTLGNEGEH
jgi:hypothetical protein